MNLPDLAWTLLATVFIVVYFMLLFRVVIDVFRSDDLGSVAKAAWFVGLLVVPVVVLVAYVLIRADGMASRGQDLADDRDARSGPDGDTAP